MIKNKDLNAVKAGQIGVDELLEKYPLKSLISDLIELVKEQPSVAPKVVITQEQFNNHFRIVGVNPDGTQQKRGRKKKVEEDII